MSVVLNNKYEKLLYIVFCVIFLCISNIFFENLPPGTGLSLYINNIVWLTSFIFVFVVVLLVIDKGSWVKPENFIIHLSLVFTLIIPFLWSEDVTGTGLYRMLGAVFGIIFFISLFSIFTKEKMWNVLLVIVISGFIQACWGIIELWFNPELTVKTGYPTAVFQQTNVMASYIATTFIASLFLISVCSISNKNVELLIKYGIYVFALFSGILIVSLISASTYLALSISIPLMLIANWKENNNVLIAILFLFVGFLIGVMFDGNYITSNGVDGRTIELSLTETFESGGRENIWLICLEMFKENWLTGIGYGNFEHLFIEYQAQYYQLNGIYAYEQINHPHNEFILWTIEGGILPAIALISYSIYTIWRMFKMGKSALPYAAILLPLVVHALLEFPFYHSAIHWILFITCLFLFELEAGKNKKVTVSFKVLTRCAATMIISVVSLFFVTNMHAMNVLNNFNNTEYEERNPDMLGDIINYFTVQTHLDYFMMDGLMKKGIEENNNSFIQKSITISEKLQANHPRPAYYKNMLVGYEALGDFKNFKLKLDEARFYYPLNKYFIGVEDRARSIYKSI